MQFVVQRLKFSNECVCLLNNFILNRVFIKMYLYLKKMSGLRHFFPKLEECIFI